MIEYIKVLGAHENNLKNVDVLIPKKKITVFTGVSGSGKSSLCMDTIAAESRRELNHTFPSFVQQYLPQYSRPKVDLIENLPITMILDQKKPALNSRSTVGTYTDIYAFLRMLFSRFGHPFVGYSEVFSYNHIKGRCKRCEGIGEIKELDIHSLVDFDKCLNDHGVINFPAFTTGAWRWKRYAYSGLFDLNKKIKDYNQEELDLFLYSPQVKLKKPPDNWPKSAKFEGIYPRMYRSIINTKEGKRHDKYLKDMIKVSVCPDCQGTRLNEHVRSCKIDGLNIADVLALQMPNLLTFINNIHLAQADSLKEELVKRVQPLIDIGLSYISLGRSMNTLSGGEAQRIKIAKYINSALTDVVYVLDEPSVGLHYHDISNLEGAILKLRDRGNTVMIVEHHPEIIKLADHIIDLGPGPGEHGGRVMFQGTYEDLLKSQTTTGMTIGKTTAFGEDKAFSDYISLVGLRENNLKGFSCRIPKEAMTVISGVAGSGKSSLLKELVDQYKGSYIHINQKNIGANSRSTPATYLDVADDIRKLFSKLYKVEKSYFSFNAKGACKNCGGKGIIVTEMGFMDSVTSICDDCHGHRYDKSVLKYTYEGHSIAEIMNLSVEEALDLFEGKIFDKLEPLREVGLSYVKLNQSLATFSGGELQRMKLASQLDKDVSLIILDEPNDGLHLNDVNKLLVLFKSLVKKGKTLVIVDHHISVLKSADYTIELGPSGGDAGGYLLYEGYPSGLCDSEKSINKMYL